MMNSLLHIFFLLSLFYGALSAPQTANVRDEASILINDEISVSIPPILKINAPVTAPLLSPTVVRTASIQRGFNGQGCFLTSNSGASMSFYEQFPLQQEDSPMMADSVTCFVPRSQGDAIVWIKGSSSARDVSTNQGRLLFIVIGDVGGSKSFREREINTAVLMNHPDSKIYCEVRSRPYYQPFMVGYPARETYRSASVVMCFRKRVPPTDRVWYPTPGKGIDRWYRYPPAPRT